MSSINFSKLRILIVDDFSEMRRNLRRMLENFGITKIQEAADASQTLALIATNDFDIIFCDYNLGNGRNGQQILEEIKYRKLIRPDTAFVMVTAEVGQDMVLSAVEYKPDDYLTKPFVSAVLKKRTEKMLNRKQRLAKIKTAIEQGALQKALELCNERLAESPRNIYDYLQLKGDILLSLGEQQQAKALYTGIVDTRPLPWAQYGLGRVEESLSNYSEACDIYEALISEHKLYMDAYDRLADCYIKRDDSKHAQSILTQATNLSPRQITRQRELGRVAHDNGDYNTATHSLRRAVKLGRDSYLKSLDDYTGLARTMAANGEGKDALKIIDNARREFKGRSDLNLQTAVIESIVYQKMGKSDLARQAMESAGIKGDLASTEVPIDITLELARTHLERSEKDEALVILNGLLQNFNEDPAIVAKVQKLFEEFQLSAEYHALLASVQKEISDINNSGVTLVKQGELDEAITLFQDAAKRLPKNKTVNLNAAQVLIMKMNQNGSNPKMLHSVHELLDRVRVAEPGNDKLLALTSMYNELK